MHKLDVNNMVDINNPNLSDIEKQNIFLECYRAQPDSQKTIKKTCEKLNLARSVFNHWLIDPQFEEVFLSELRSLTYSLSESLMVNAAEMMECEEGISKNRFNSLLIAQRSIESMIGRINKDRFSEQTTIDLKTSQQIIPSINISLISADIPSIEHQYQASLANDKALTIDVKKEALEAPIIESVKSS